MKKITIIATMFFAISLFAQKPESGTFTSQVGFAFSNDFANVNSLGLNGRYFLNESMALRLGVGINNTNETYNFAENIDGTGPTGTFISKNRLRNINLGFEKHFNGTSKLSPFFAVELGLFGGGFEDKGTNADDDSYISGYNYKETGSIRGIGFNFGLGFDYWFTEGLYIGIEYQPIAWYTFKNKGVETEINGVKIKEIESSYSLFSSFSTTPFVRLGWRFN